MTGANTLPDDIETLKAMLREREARLDERDVQVTHLQETVESQKAALASRAAEVEHLNLLIAKLRRMQFGRKSEKLDHQIEQLELRLEDLQADEGAAPVEIPKTPPTAPERSQRKPLPEHLPRDTHTYLPESAGVCTQCGAAMKQLGEDISEQLEYVPASFRVIRHVRPKFACTCCDHIAQVSAPGRPSSEAWPGRDCWRMCSWRSSPIICRFTGSRSSMPAKVLSLSGQRWPGGLATAQRCCDHWSTQSGGT